MSLQALSSEALIDTGAIVALLDRTDRWHRICVDAFPQFRLPLITSEAVLTELFQLSGDSRHEMASAWKFLRSGAVRLGEIEDSELPRIRELMSRYWDRRWISPTPLLCISPSGSRCRRFSPWIMRTSKRTELKAAADSGYFRSAGRDRPLK